MSKENWERFLAFSLVRVLDAAVTLRCCRDPSLEGNFLIRKLMETFDIPRALIVFASLSTVGFLFIFVLLDRAENRLEVPHLETRRNRYLKWTIRLLVSLGIAYNLLGPASWLIHERLLLLTDIETFAIGSFFWFFIIEGSFIETYSVLLMLFENLDFLRGRWKVWLETGLG